MILSKLKKKKNISVIGIDIKSPIEKVIEILKTVQEATDSEYLVLELEW